MLTNFFTRNHIVLKKGKNLHIFFHLFINKLLLLKLQLYKKIHRINHPIVHYYAVCWNEEKILPFMFDHYKRFVNHFTIYDNRSTDHSINIICSRTDTTLVEFDSDGFCDNNHNEIKNNCWKKSRGHADFVIVCDLDEFLYHPDIKNKLAELKHNHISVVKPVGYDMYCDIYPDYQPGSLLSEQIPNGVRATLFDKCILFDPHSVVEINYKPGAHECHPWGKIKTTADSDIKLLHYKNLGIDWLLERNRLYVQRLSKDNIENEYGIQYLKSEDIITADFQANLQQAKKVTE